MSSNPLSAPGADDATLDALLDELVSEARDVEKYHIWMRHAQHDAESRANVAEIRTKIHALLSARSASREDATVPGSWKCDQCGFVQVTIVLNPLTGVSGAQRVVDADELRCPNDGSALRGETWRERAEVMRGIIERQDAELAAARSSPSEGSELTPAQVEQWLANHGFCEISVAASGTVTLYDDDGDLGIAFTRPSLTEACVLADRFLAEVPCVDDVGEEASEAAANAWLAANDPREPVSPSVSEDAGTPDASWFGCLTGDCPHELQGQCDAAIRAEFVRLTTALARAERNQGGSEDARDAARDGVSLIAAERRRQIEKEGWTPAHDDTHVNGELAVGAACYAMPSTLRRHYKHEPLEWKWAACDWKPTPDDRVRELVKAGALIAAEIDRLHRARMRG